MPQFDGSPFPLHVPVVVVLVALLVVVVVAVVLVIVVEQGAPHMYLQSLNASAFAALLVLVHSRL